MSKHIDYDCNNVDIRKVQIKDLICIKQLGQGSYGVVMLYKNIVTGKLYAVKLLGIKKPIKNYLADIQHELHVLNKMKVNDKECHPNLLCIESYGQVNNYIYIISEYIDGISLKSYIKLLKSKKKALHIDQFLYITEQLLNGLKFLHYKQIGHSDIKPDNIMINPKTLQVKIIDPGLACSKLIECTTSGSPMYMAPEMLGIFADKVVYPKDVKKADVFSLGFTLYILFYKGKYPTVSNFSTKCTNEYYNVESIKLNSTYPELNYMIDNMLQSNPTKRWGVLKCVKELAKLKEKI